MPRRGRPRGFDKQDALQQAMEVFWSLGYEGATLTDLQQAMGGITAPSFYAAFGSKEALFRQAVELYSRTLGAPMMRVLVEETTARAALQALLDGAVESFLKPGKPRGCMLVLAAINGTPANKGVQDHLHALRARRRKAIQRRLERGIDEGELRSDLDASAMAAYFTTVIDGLAIQAHDGASRRALRFTVRCAMAAWNGMAGGRS